jgi:chitinase
VDYIDLMTYDFHGGWDKGSFASDFMSAMNLDPNNDPAFTTSPNPVLQKYDAVDAVNTYLDNGVAAKQLIMGIPLYGRAVNIASSGNSYGLYQTITGVPMGEYDDSSSSGATGVFDYKCIVNNSLCYANGSVLSNLIFVDPTQNSYGKYAMTPWAYSANLFLTYDDNNAATYKANWVKQHGLGGVMFWELSGDPPASNPQSLVNAVYQVFSSQK